MLMLMLHAHAHDVDRLFSVEAAAASGWKVEPCQDVPESREGKGS